VSRVLNGDSPVNADTRRLVENAMESLAYVPSSAARTMRSNRTGLVGLVSGAISGQPAEGAVSGLPDLQIVRGIQKILADVGITLLIADIAGDAQRIAQLIRTLREHRVEGLFYVADHHLAIDLPDSARTVPLVLVNAFDDANDPCVLPDDEHGQHALTSELLARGHRRIGYLSLGQSLVAHRLRLRAYQRALGEADIDFDPALVADADRGGRPGERALMQSEIERLMALPEPPTVLCCGNDRLAVAAYGILRARGIAVPEQMSVAGYDDYRVISETLYPQLTTMELPYARMGEAAARMMLALLRDGEAPEETRIVVRGELRWRDSVIAVPVKNEQQSDQWRT
jgi:LacI family transcriptional regulator